MMLSLETGETREFESVSEWRFDASGRFLALLGHPPEEPAGKGADLRVVSLATDAETSFGNVGEMAWSASGSLLAMAVATGTDLGNGVQVYDPVSGTLTSADASGARYRSLGWRDDSADLAALRSRADASEEGTVYDVLAWRGLDRGVEMMVLGEGTVGIADTLEVVDQAPEWSDDGTMISIGLWPGEDDAVESNVDPAEDGQTGANEREVDGEGGSPTGDPEDSSAGASGEPDLPGLQIWHSRTFGSTRSNRRRRAETRAARCWPSGTWTGTASSPSARISGRPRRCCTGGTSPWRTSPSPTPRERCSGDPITMSGPSTWRPGNGQPPDPGALRMAERGGSWLVSYDGASYASVEIATGERHNLTSALPTAFADTEYDTPTDVLPPYDFGPGAWLEGDAGVLLYDRHDVWRWRWTEAARHG